MTPADRDRIEADLTFARVVELELDPVRGDFDAAHLREINRRIFQDLPGAGLSDVTPGQFRQPVPEGKDWLKHRGLSSVAGAFYVAYSRMDEAACVRLDQSLRALKPDVLRVLITAEFSAHLATHYAELDYVHPFPDGNSRTLRTFTRQLAREAGYELGWERYGGSNTGRDALYIARDLSVMDLAKPLIQDAQSMLKIVHSADRLAGNKSLRDLIVNVVRPSRAVAFESLPPEEALARHPELQGAYDGLQALRKQLSVRFAGDEHTQQTYLEQVRTAFIRKLDSGERSVPDLARVDLSPAAKVGRETGER